MPSRADAPAHPEPRQNRTPTPAPISGQAPRWSTGRRVLAGAILAALAGDALAFVDLYTSGPYAPDGVTQYQMYAASCPVATGNGATSCGTNVPGTSLIDLRDNGDVLFVWGSAGGTDDTGSNSTILWQNTLPYAVKVVGVTLSADAPVGTAPGATATGGNLINQPQGQGVISAWELAPPVADTLIGDARVQIINRWSGDPAERYAWYANPTDIATENRLVAASALADSPWVDIPNHTTVKTPLNNVPPLASPLSGRYFTATGDEADNAIAAGEDIQIRFFDARALTDSSPSAVLAPVTVQVQYSRADLQGRVEFGNVRVGTTATTVAEVRNLTDATGGFRALGVELGTLATGEGFASVGGPTDLGQVDAGLDYQTTGAQFTYAPTALADGSLSGNYANSQTSSAIDLTSTDALDTNFKAHGTAVGPVFNLSGYDVPGATIAMGDVNIGDPNQLKELSFRNLFKTNLGNLTDLGLMRIGFAAYDDPLNTNLLDRLDQFKLGSLAALPMKTGDAPFEVAASGGTSLTDFWIEFDPGTVVGSWKVWLTFVTDVGVGNLDPGGEAYRFLVTGSTSGSGPVPLPGTLALLGLGLAGLRWRRVWG